MLDSIIIIIILLLLLLLVNQSSDVFFYYIVMYINLAWLIIINFYVCTQHYAVFKDPLITIMNWLTKPSDY